MKCPHCGTAYHSDFKEIPIGQDRDGGWSCYAEVCPECHRLILALANGSSITGPGNKYVGISTTKTTFFVYPKAINRPPCPPEVSAHITEDYKEACFILAESPKASAALSRRCLQNILRDAGGIAPSDLSNEIQQVLDSGTLPTQLAKSIDSIRNIGNFAAHPTKSKTTGVIVPVEPVEAEWNLDVLESLFDFYYVQPKMIENKREALDKKLLDAGKPPMK